MTKKKVKTWNTNKENGWAVFRNLTENNKVLKSVNFNEIKEPTNECRKIENEIEKCKFKSFGKVTYRPERNRTINTDRLIEEKSDILKCKKIISEEDYKKLNRLDEEIAQAIKTDQRNKLEKEFEKIKRNLATKGRSKAIFNLKNDIVGNRNKSLEPSALICPKTKEMMTDKSKIKTITLNYCLDLLTAKEPEENYKEIIKLKKKVHKKRLREIVPNDTSENEFTYELFDDAFKDLQKYKSNKYKFITGAGNDFKLAMFNLFKYVWEKESKPDQWSLDTLVQIHK